MAWKVFIKLSVLMLLTNIVSAELPLQDSTATINQLFIYKINPEDFPGEKIQIVQSGLDELPSWLVFDNINNELIGMPSAKDKGTYILAVGKEMFAITVVEPTRNQVAQLTNSNTQIICKPHDSITMVYVKLNADVDSLSVQRKLQLVNGISKHLSIKPNHVSISVQPTDLLDSNAALVSGIGDAPPSTEGPVSVISYAAGCGAVKSNHMDILEKLESSTKDGTIGKILGLSVNGWQVQSNQPKNMSKRRLKRQAFVTATPSPSASVIGDETTTKSSSSDGPDPTASVTTTSTTTTEPQLTNNKPVLNTNLLPTNINVYGGQLVRWTIPYELFTDADGDSLTYSIQPSSSSERWIVTNEIAGNLEIVGVPDKSITNQNETLMLTASDSAGAMATAAIKINYGEDQQKYLTEMYKLKIDAESSSPVRSTNDVVYMALTIQQLTSIDNILITEMHSELGIIKLTIGDNRGNPTSCPRERNAQVLADLKKLVDEKHQLIGAKEGTLNLAAVDLIMPMPPCEDQKPVVNEKLMVKYRLLRINLGELYETVLPHDLFTDYEDGSFPKLRISLISNSLEDSSKWISLNSATRKLEVFTLTFPETGSQFSLTAVDSAGNEADEDIQVEIIDNSASHPPTHLITLTFNKQYSSIADSLEKKITLYNKINNAFSDATVAIKAIKDGSTIVQFSLHEEDTTTPPDQCPTSIQSYVDTIFDGENVKKSFDKQFKSYELKKAEFVALGSCQDKIKDRTAAITYKEVIVEPGDEEKNTMPIIIAVVVVVLIIIIIIIIVVVCVRKKKAQKAKAGQNGSYIEKGVPVRLEEEMRTADKSENQPLMTSAEVSYKQTATPPAYPGKKHGDNDYEPDTPPASEPDDERGILDRST